jgi:hypothetical protein
LAIVAHLKEQLRRGDKSLVGNKGYRRYLKVEGESHFALDEKQIKPTGAVHCNKDLIEEALFERRRDLFTEVELVFLDTTSLYFEGASCLSLPIWRKCSAKAFSLSGKLA